MKKILILLLALAIGATCLTACSSEKSDEDDPEKGDIEVIEEDFTLGSAGLDDMLDITFPAGYQSQGNDILSDQDNVLLATWYGDGNASVCAMILSHDGEAVMGSENTFEEWKKNHDDIADHVKVGDTGSEAIVYPIGLNTTAAEDINDSMIEAVFEYQGYVIKIGMSSENGESLTQEQKQSFYDMLKNVKAKGEKKKEK